LRRHDPRPPGYAAPFLRSLDRVWLSRVRDVPPVAAAVPHKLAGIGWAPSVKTHKGLVHMTRT
jgi:hypothetical protein